MLCFFFLIAFPLVRAFPSCGMAGEVPCPSTFSLTNCTASPTALRTLGKQAFTHPLLCHFLLTAAPGQCSPPLWATISITDQMPEDQEMLIQRCVLFQLLVT